MVLSYIYFELANKKVQFQSWKINKPTNEFFLILTFLSSSPPVYLESALFGLPFHILLLYFFFLSFFSLTFLIFCDIFYILEAVMTSSFNVVVCSKYFHTRMSWIIKCLGKFAFSAITTWEHFFKGSGHRKEWKMIFFWSPLKEVERQQSYSHIRAICKKNHWTKAGE